MQSQVFVFYHNQSHDLSDESIRPVDCYLVPVDVIVA